MLQMVAEVQKMRWFQIWAVLHARANSGSVGHARPGRYMSQPDKPSITPDPANTQALCRLSVISMGKLLVSAATVAPRPTVTSMIGRAQQTRVPVEASRASQLTPDSARICLIPWATILSLFIAVSPSYCGR